VTEICTCSTFFHVRQIGLLLTFFGAFFETLSHIWNQHKILCFGTIFNVLLQKSLKIIPVLALFANFEAKHAINCSKIEKLVGIQFCTHHRACVIFFSLKKSNSSYPFYGLPFFFCQWCRWVLQGGKIVGFKEKP
jgi:hypothetical protein